MLDLSQKLSAHFTLSEFVTSQTASRHNIDNTPPAAAIDNLRRVCAEILEPVRAHFGLPVTVSSGYRSAALNKAVGSKPSSQHRLGEAVDFEIPGVSNRAVAEWISKNLAYDQVILEFHKPSQPSSGWVHVSYRHGGNRKQPLFTINA